MTTFELRPVDPAGPYLRPFVELSRLAFKDNSPVTDEMIAARRRAFAQARVTGAFDGDRLVGTFRTWDTRLTLPGSPERDVAATAVSTVAVLPTHTRRGILTALMRDNLDAAAAGGSAVAVLIASEAVIYGRFGFGPATETTAIEVDLRRARIRPEVPDPGGVEYVTPDELGEVAPAVYAAGRRPGEIDRDRWWWNHFLGRPEAAVPPPGRRVDLLRRDASGTPDGYLVYRFKDSWEHRVSSATIEVQELFAAGPEANAALWRYLFSIDAVAALTADPRPLDEPLAAMLVDPRALHRTERSDMLWARLLDVPVFFTRRGYEAGLTGTVVFEVEDPLGYAAGRFELTVDGAGRGQCRLCPDGDPQVRLPVDVLSSVSLGGGDLAAAHAAGRLSELEDGAAARLATLLHTTRPPYEGTWF